MTTPPLHEAAEALREHYGRQPAPGDLGAWSTLVKLIVGRSLPPERLGKCWATLSETVLCSAAETETARVPEIQETLEGVGRAARSATVLKALAAWWMSHADEESRLELSRDASGRQGLETLRDELRQISGLSPEQADRILLFVAGEPAYPLDRSSIRIACRHGWLDCQTDYAEWQAFFINGLAEAGIDPQQFSLWASRLGKEYCGPQPKCESCPLRHLLPPNGPYKIDE
jgi:endonuclease III-like uncharacterized protein